MELTKEMKEAARLERNRYQREWAHKNPEKIKATRERYWAKRAQERMSKKGETPEHHDSNREVIYQKYNNNYINKKPACQCHTYDSIEPPEPGPEKVKPDDYVDMIYDEMRDRMIGEERNQEGEHHGN
ncbi:MAG: hypothetical protein VB031_02405 [Eubacteriaceae bacterium]|nr:hypothetical protein [Eubacteriaceae bacterium]